MIISHCCAFICWPFFFVIHHIETGRVYITSDSEGQEQTFLTAFTLKAKFMKFHLFKQRLNINETIFAVGITNYIFNIEFNMEW